MKANKTKSAAMAQMIALNTRTEGANLRKKSESNAIGKPKTRLCAVLRPLLERRVPGHILARREAEAKPAAVRLRCKAADLIHFREIFRADGVENISRKLSLRPMRERKRKSSQAGRPPVDAGIGEMAARLGEAEGPGPIARKVDDGCFIHGQDSCRRVPIPVLPVSQFNAANWPALADFEAVIEFEERFRLGYHSVVVSRCSANREGAPFRLAPGYATDEISGVDASSLVEAHGGAGGPASRPVGNQAHPLILVCGREGKEIGVEAKTQFLLSLAAKRR